MKFDQIKISFQNIYPHTFQECSQIEKSCVAVVAVPSRNVECIFRMKLGCMWIPIDNYDFAQISVQSVKTFHMMSINEMCCC